MRCGKTGITTRKIRVATMNGKAMDDAGNDAGRGGAMADGKRTASGFSWERWQEKLERLCELGAMCVDDERTLEAFKRRVGREGGQARRGDGESLLTERAVLTGVPAEEVWRRRSPVSLGGACRMMFSADGMVAVNLPRDDDWQMLPALFGMLGLEWDEAVTAWEAAGRRLESAVARLQTEDLVCAAGELGLAVAEVGSCGDLVVSLASPQAASPPTSSFTTISPAASSPASASSKADSPTTGFNDSHGRSVILPPPPQTSRPLRDAKVVDLSVMWAGPLCGDLLARAGAQVVKAESPGRPDGARRGLPEFYERLNGRKQHRSIGLDASEGQAELRDLLQNADIVITSCRPRALEQMGIDPHDVVSQSGVIWAGITGYGWEQGHKVAFGDDAAAAGGLVCSAERLYQEAEFTGGGCGRAPAADTRAERLSQEAEITGGNVENRFVFEGEGELSERKRDRESSARVLPSFIGDAIADPLTGVTAAVAVMEQWLSGTPEFLDISMVGSAAFFCEED